MPLFALEPWQMALLLAPAVLNTWGIWHVFKHTFASPVERLIWLAVCVGIPILGGFVYLFFGRKRVTGKTGPLFISPNQTVTPAEDADIDEPEPLPLDELKTSQNVVDDVQHANENTIDGLELVDDLERPKDMVKGVQYATKDT